jgi:hypothetical protein
MKFSISTKKSKISLIEMMKKAKVKLTPSNLTIGWAEDDGYSFEAIIADETFLQIRKKLN